MKHKRNKRRARCLMFLFFIILIGVLSIIFKKNLQNLSRELIRDDKSISSENYSIKTIDNLSRPFATIRDSEGNLYISDFNENAILVYDKNFKLLRKIGTPGSKPGELSKPHAVDFDAENNLLVTDYGNNRIQKFSQNGNFISMLPSPKLLLGPATSYFDRDYNLYVSDYGSNSLLKFSNDDKFLGWIGAKEDGTLTDGWQTNGTSTKTSLPGGFDRLHAAKVSQNGTIYVIDSWNNRVEKFSHDGKFSGWIGAKEDGTLTDGWQMTGTATQTNSPGGFNSPVALELVDDRELVILEFGNPRVQRFSVEGKFLGWFGATQNGPITKGWEKTGLAREGSEPGAIRGAYDIRVYKNKIYITDTGNKRIQEITFN